jgi:hypothetical protein
MEYDELVSIDEYPLPWRPLTFLNKKELLITDRG